MWLRRKKASLPVESLINLIDSVLFAADGSCTQCLIDELGNENDELPRVIVDLEDAYASRSTSPDGEENFAGALAAYLNLVTQMAVYTAELMRRPGVRWTDETVEMTIPVIVIPN